jgi:hypothetical protein
MPYIDDATPKIVELNPDPLDFAYADVLVAPS